MDGCPNRPRPRNLTFQPTNLTFDPRRRFPATTAERAAPPDVQPWCSKSDDQG